MGFSSLIYVSPLWYTRPLGIMIPGVCLHGMYVKIDGLYNMSMRLSKICNRSFWAYCHGVFVLEVYVHEVYDHEVYLN